MKHYTDSLGRNVDLMAASPADRLPLYRMLELYQYELSDIWDQDLDVHGEYGYALDRYWSNKQCHPFIAKVEGAYAGFALVDHGSPLGAGPFWMDQFFVLKKFRRAGLGGHLAHALFKRLPGLWNVGEMNQNKGAHAFWTKVIAKTTRGNFEERTLTEGWWQGRLQEFTTSAD